MENNDIGDLLDKIQDPSNSLTPDERKNVKNITKNVETSLKTSLVSLLMNQFSKISAYDSVIGSTLAIIAKRAETMDDQDLIAFLSVLSKVSSSESKNIMDLFKKNDSDLKQFLKEIQKLTKGSEDEDGIDKPKKGEVLELTLEKKEKVLRVIEKLNSKDT